MAVLVAVLANPATPQAALPHFRHLWLFSCAMAIATGAISLLLPPAWARAGSPRPGDAAPKPAMMPASATSE